MEEVKGSIPFSSTKSPRSQAWGFVVFGDDSAIATESATLSQRGRSRSDGSSDHRLDGIAEAAERIVPGPAVDQLSSCVQVAGVRRRLHEHVLQHLEQ